jgi:hypothetical protein
MCEKSLLMYWADKGQNATIISAKMESYFGSSAPSYSLVTKWPWVLKRGESTFELCERSGRAHDPLTGLRVLEFLNSTPFASTCQIATTTKGPRQTVLDHLKGWGSIVQHLKWVPYHLTTAIMEPQMRYFENCLSRSGRQNMVDGFISLQVMSPGSG